MFRDKPSLLVVEDDPVQQKVIQMLCERYDYHAVFVSTGLEALRALETCDGCFDAVLMDIKMPDMNGLECAAAVRKQEAEKGSQRVPIIAVTAYAMSGDREKCLAAGMDDYLSKPFTIEDFRAILLRWTYDPDRPNLKLLPTKPGPGSAISDA
jgi:CheY-like chemotaxis protein